MADVFISYSRENAPSVRRLAEAVTREGYSVWWDDALPPHLSYGDVITGEIGAAKAAIVVWSETAIASEWVRAEADLARNQKKLVQTSIDGRMPPMPFNQLHFVSIGDWRGEDDHPGWVRVKESLAALCRGEVAQPAYAFPPTAPPRPAPPPAGQSALRLALMVGGLLLLGAVGAAAFWLLGGGCTSCRGKRSPAAPPGVGAELSAPAAAAPSHSTAPVRASRIQPRTRPQTQPMNMRRYCSGPGAARRDAASFAGQPAGTAAAD